MFDRKTRDLYHMGKQSGHRIQFPQMTIDEHELDHALDEASVPKPVFDAFDESLLFQDEFHNLTTLKKQFKGVFKNISSVLDCVTVH